MAKRNHIGVKVKKRRNELELSQNQLGEFLGFTQAYVSYIEKGEKEITTDTLKKLKIILRTTYEYLLDDEKNSTKKSPKK